MKLVRYGSARNERPGIVDESGNIRDITHCLKDISSQHLTEENINQLFQLNLTKLPVAATVDTIRIGPCIHQVGKLICVAYNSKQHLQEMGLPVPDEIVFFLKASSAIIGPTDPIFYPKLGKKLDWEAELAMIIGKEGKNIKEEEALEYVLGFTCINDLSDRYWQFDKVPNQHGAGKSFDTLAPLGPYLITKDEIGDLNNIRLQCLVNNEIRQDFTVSDSIRSPQQLISHLSRIFTLYPGDVIAIGTGAGTAKTWGNTFLKPGDEIVLRTDIFGTQKNLIIME